MGSYSNIPRRKFIRAIRQLGFEVNESRGKGSHAVIRHPTDRTRKAILPIRDPIAGGTLRDVLKGLGVSIEELRSLL